MAIVNVDARGKDVHWDIWAEGISIFTPKDVVHLRMDKDDIDRVEFLIASHDLDKGLKKKELV